MSLGSTFGISLLGLVFVHLAFASDILRSVAVGGVVLRNFVLGSRGAVVSARRWTAGGEVTRNGWSLGSRGGRRGIIVVLMVIMVMMMLAVVSGRASLGRALAKTSLRSGEDTDRGGGKKGGEKSQGGRELHLE